MNLDALVDKIIENIIYSFECDLETVWSDLGNETKQMYKDRWHELIYNAVRYNLAPVREVEGYNKAFGKENV